MSSYRIGAELGSGAIGRVVEVFDDAGNAWAGKILHASQRADQRAQRRFESEAKLLTGIKHDTLIEVIGLVDLDGQAVMLMELVVGSNLARIIAAQAPLAVERVVDLGRQIAAGLAAAHRAALVHRDLKPANVLVSDDGVAKVADFGLARAASFATSDPDAVAVAGTPDYMAPESVDPLAIDARSDLYALGCILCELATGAPPYRGATAFAVLQAHRDESLPGLVEVAAPLRNVILRLLAKSPADRPQSADEVAAALAAIVDPTTAPNNALSTTRVAANSRACARCGAIGPDSISVCFGCGQSQLQLSSGGMTVFVVGPGDVAAAQLDSELRQRLLTWLQANPALGLDTKTLLREVPRLPFVLVANIDDTSARALIPALDELGLVAVAVRGGRFALPEIRKKAWTLGKRILVISGSVMFWPLNNLGPAALAAGAITVGGAALFGGINRAGKPATKLLPSARIALPSVFDAALARVAAVVPAMTAARHRDALRGVVERALGLRDAVERSRRAELEPQLAELIELAALAASRLDQLEAQLSADDLRPGDEAKRDSWQARDRWSSKLLQVTAFLDAMRARAVMARAKGAGLLDLDGVRDHLAALQELA